MDRTEISFCRFSLDLSQRQLVRDGKPVQLGSRALDILCVLASAKGEVVTKDDLMTQVWPGLVVEENNIQVHVSALRKALDEGGSSQTRLLTVPGRGYRLVGLNPPRSVADGSQDSSLSATPLEKPSIAVLPFQNMSGDPEQEYFADGMVDEIITGLSRIKWLSVLIPPAYSFQLWWAAVYAARLSSISCHGITFRIAALLLGRLGLAARAARFAAITIDRLTPADSANQISIGGQTTC